MSKDRKESRQFNISVEGINCERMYFEHLARLINSSGENKYNIRLNCKKASPESFAKRNAHLPVEKRGNKNLPFLHIQDIEDYYDDKQKKKFLSLIDEIRKTEKEYGVCYELGYTNYTFELWMLLHVADMTVGVTHRYAYLKGINRYFARNFKTLDEFKSANEFQKILDEYVTLDSVRKAVCRAEQIVNSNYIEKKQKENYKGFQFFCDNPDVNVHNLIKLIFDVCGLSK